MQSNAYAFDGFDNKSLLDGDFIPNSYEINIMQLCNSNDRILLFAAFYIDCNRLSFDCLIFSEKPFMQKKPHLIFLIP